MRKPTHSLWRPYGAHQLKATYQKHMLFGMLGAALIMLVPTGVFLLLWSPPEVLSCPVVDMPIVAITDTLDLDGINMIDDQVRVRPPSAPKQTLSETGIINPVQDNFVKGADVELDNEIDYGEPGGEGDPLSPFEPTPIVFGTGEGGDQLPLIDSFVPVDQLPILVTAVEPEYPRMAKQAGLEGRVYIKALIDKSGTVRDVRVLVSSAVNSLDTAAVRAGWNNVYRPAIRDNQAVAVWVSYRVEFTLE